MTNLLMTLLLQGHYPERIRRIFMIHVPYIFYGAWKLVSPFIDKVTRDKVGQRLCHHNPIPETFGTIFQLFWVVT